MHVKISPLKFAAMIALLIATLSSTTAVLALTTTPPPPPQLPETQGNLVPTEYRPLEVEGYVASEPGLQSASASGSPNTAATLSGPAPVDTSVAVGGFDDVPASHYAADHIASLASDGVFNGTECGPSRFCLNDPMPRWVMAVWLVRVLDGRDPTVKLSRFADITGSPWWEPHVERLAELGVTTGCSTVPKRYCPYDTVTRAQTASFLTRAFQLPAGPHAGFSDVGSNDTHYADINSLLAAGVTTGCNLSPKRYCPQHTTTRGQMATFLGRALGINAPIEDPIGDVSLAPLYGLTSQTDVQHIVLEVHYCGPTEGENVYGITELSAEVARLQTHVDEFFRRESGYVEDPARGTRVSFEVGNILTPSVTWVDSETIGSWSRAYMAAQNGEIPSFDDPCRKEAEKLDGRYPNVLILVNRPMDGTAGYAFLNQGPAVAAIRQISNDDESYLATVTHEIGHAFYGWKHPWEDLNLDPEHSLADRYKYENEFSERAMSIMSYVKYGAKVNISSLAAKTEAAYVACYQRQIHGWVERGVDEKSCPLPPLTPETPTDLRLTPGDRQISVSWKAPDDRGSNIIDYDIQYRIENGRWKDWQVGNSLQTVITGLNNGTSYDVRLQAINRIGLSGYSASQSTTPRSDPPPRVTLSVGASAQGASGVDGPCTSVHCRWLNIELENFGPGPHTLLCAHNGVEAAGFSRGVWKDTVVSGGLSTDDCLFGYPGSEVFVVVGAERRNGYWHGGTYSDVVVWPDCIGDPNVCAAKVPSNYIYNDDPNLEDNRGEYSWWKPPVYIDRLGYGDNGFHFTLAIGNADDSELDNWASWELDAADNRYEVQAWIPENWATAHAQYLIWSDENGDGTFSDDEYVDGPWLNQEIDSGWQTLGEYDLNGRVRIEVRDVRARDDWNDVGAVYARLAVDAIRLREI